MLLRCGLVSLLWYLPSHLLGRQPMPPPNLALLQRSDYYALIALLFPPYALTLWLVGATINHLLLRLLGRKSNLRQILNINGMAQLVSAGGILLGDWFYLGMGWGQNVMLWGYMHLLIDVWYDAFMVVGLKRILGAPVWLGVALLVLNFAWGVPLAMWFMRG